MDVQILGSTLPTFSSQNNNQYDDVQQAKNHKTSIAAYFHLPETIRQSLIDARKNVQDMHTLLNRDIKDAAFRDDIKKGSTNVEGLKQRLTLLSGKIDSHFTKKNILGRLYCIFLKVIGFFGSGIYGEIKCIAGELNVVQKQLEIKKNLIEKEEIFEPFQEHLTTEILIEGTPIKLAEELYALKSFAKKFNISNLYGCTYNLEKNAIELSSISTSTDFGAVTKKNIYLPKQNSDQYSVVIPGSYKHDYNTFDELLKEEIKDAVSVNTVRELQAVFRVSAPTDIENDQIDVWEVGQNKIFKNIHKAEESLINASTIYNKLYYLFCLVTTKSESAFKLLYTKNAALNHNVAEITLDVKGARPGYIMVGNGEVCIKEMKKYLESNKDVYGDKALLNKETGAAVVIQSP